MKRKEVERLNEKETDMKNSLRAILSVLIVTCLTTTAFAAQAPKMKMTTDIPESITTPDRVE
ncbi:hypothetical protein ACFL6U_21680, partial [Planctomycetota bacterium]